MNKKQGLSNILGVILVLIVLGGGVYLYTKNKAETPVSSDIASNVDTTNWQIYRNEKHGFEFKYPPEWEWGDDVLPYEAKHAYYSVSIEEYGVAREIGNVSAEEASERLDSVKVALDSGEVPERFTGGATLAELITLSSGKRAVLVTGFDTQGGVFYQAVKSFSGKNLVGYAVILPLGGTDQNTREDNPDLVPNTLSKIQARQVDNNVLSVLNDFEASLDTFKFTN